MPNKNKKKIFHIVIPISIILIAIAVIAFIAYKADTAGVKVGAPNFYLASPPPKQNLKRKHTTKQSFKGEKEETLKQKVSRLFNEDSSEQAKDKENTSASKKSSPNGFNGQSANGSGTISKNKKTKTASSFDAERSEGKSLSQTKKDQPMLQKRNENLKETSEHTSFANRLTPPKSDQKIFYAFSSPEKQLQPSTLGILHTKELLLDTTDKEKRQKLKTTNIHMKLSGDIAKELFLFNLYNTLCNGALALEGSFTIKPKGKETDQRTDVLFFYKENDFNNSTQLPVIMNGKISPQSYPQYNVNINKFGKLYCQSPLYIPVPIKYTITRMTENSSIDIKQPISLWLKKEFETIPENIKVFFENAKNTSNDYKMLFLYTVLNKFFGYQRDILSVELPLGKTWTQYLGSRINKNERLLADCDVLSTYAFIFSKYLGMDTVVCAGYNNIEPKTMDTLDPSEYHAALLVKVNNNWILFDPSIVVPDFTEKALLLSAKTETDNKAIRELFLEIQQKDQVSNKNNSLYSAIRTKPYTITKKTLSLLSEALDNEPQQAIEKDPFLQLSSLFAPNSELSKIYYEFDPIPFCLRLAKELLTYSLCGPTLCKTWFTRYIFLIS